MPELRILIVDDHGIVRMGIKSLLESQPDIVVVGEATQGEEAVNKALQLKPDLVLMDIAMPGMGGIEATRQIKKDMPDVNVLVLTVHDDEEYFFPVLRAGASGFILKDADPQELLYAIRVVHRGQVFLSPTVTKALLQSFSATRSGPDEEKYYSLTTREKEVLRLVAAGSTNREIGEKLFISIRTVEKHRQSMMRKLGFVSREDLTRYAIHKGLISLDD